MIDRWAWSESYLAGGGSYREGYSQGSGTVRIAEENRTGYCTVSLTRKP